MQLKATDNGDNTGARLEVTGNSGTASIYVSRFAGTNASRAFTLAGTIVGDGYLDSAIATGPYVGLAVNATPELSEPIFFRVTNGAESLHWRIMEAVREYILSLALPAVSVDPDDHVLVKLPYRASTELNIENSLDTCVYYFPKPETYDGANNEDDTVSYLVQILLIRKAAAGSLVKGLRDMLMDRQLIGQSMSLSPLEDACEVHTVHIQPGAVIMPEHWAKNYDCSSIVLKCVTEQPAGIL